MSAKEVCRRIVVYGTMTVLTAIDIAARIRRAIRAFASTPSRREIDPPPGPEK